MELVIGTKAWSTWSMRPWLVLTRLGAPFVETLITLRQENDMTTEAILPHSPTGLVPALKVAGADGDVVTIPDSLAICEYLAERFPEAGLWPADGVARALARSAAAQMHAGYRPLRIEMPMDLAAAPAAPGSVEVSEAVGRDVGKIVRLWSQMLTRFGGPWLAGGEWGIADAFFTPVATRFETYGVVLGEFGDGDGLCQAYCERLLQRPEYLAWKAGA